jgi:hypothetical protein
MLKRLLLEASKKTPTPPAQSSEDATSLVYSTAVVAETLVEF